MSTVDYSIVKVYNCRTLPVADAMARWSKSCGGVYEQTGLGTLVR